MKKTNISKICYLISSFLLFGFIIHIIVDYHRYNSTLNSAPFYLWVIVNGIYFIVPAIIALAVGIVAQNKCKSKGI